MLMQTHEKERQELIYRDSSLRAPYTDWSFAKRFWIFQNERIPLIPLAIMAMLLTAAIAKADSHFLVTRFAIASGAIILYFLEIRLADEPKDYEHDQLFYPDRPVQRGLVTLTELAFLNKFVIVLGFGLGLFTGSYYVLALACIQQAYAFLTRREFYLRDWLRDHFVIYQFSHYVQLFILGWFILTILEIHATTDKWLYFGYAIITLFVVESSRTIGGSDGVEAKDRYSYRWGVNLSLMIYIAFATAGIAYTVFLIQRIDGTVYWPILGIGLAAVAFPVNKYRTQPTLKNAKRLNEYSLIVYICVTTTLLLG